MHIISDADKMQRAGELAEVISGVICLPEITFLVKFLIIAVWALLESAIDIKCLLSGGKVPIIKTRTIGRRILTRYLKFWKQGFGQ